jgi:hypothetical protein
MVERDELEKEKTNYFHPTHTAAEKNSLCKKLNFMRLLIFHFTAKLAMLRACPNTNRSTGGPSEGSASRHTRKRYLTSTNPLVCATLDSVTVSG